MCHRSVTQFSSAPTIQAVSASLLESDTRWSTRRGRLLAIFLRPIPRPFGWGVVVALSFIAAEIVVVLLLKQVAPENAFGAVLLLGVLVVSAGWGFGLALATSLVSALVYVYFHLEGSDTLAPAVIVFLTLALLVNLVAGQARLRAEEAEQRSREADLSADLARVLLRATELRGALDGAGHRLAEVLGLRFAILSLDEVTAENDAAAVPLWDGSSRIGTLLVPGDLDRAARLRVRVRRMIPSLEALLAAAREREDRLRAAGQLVEASHAEVAALARQQAALRRVATLVARGAEPTEVFAAAVAQLARGLGAEHVTLVGYDSDDSCVVLAAHQGPNERNDFRAGEQLSLEGDSVTALIRRTARPTRIDDYDIVRGPIVARLRNLGLRSGVGVPVVVDGILRAAFVIGSAHAMPADTEARIVDFADLVATAIFNAETRAEITASRARIVAAADHARRGFERDLHDGAQQRIVSLGLQLRAVESALPAELTDVHEQLNRTVEGLGGLYTDLQELSRGLHPAILSRGGLGPAIKTLARRSAIPVRLDLGLDGRLPESVEVAAYYVVAEALTNATKHARATGVTVSLTIKGSDLAVRIDDDGIGGALTGGGSGLVGLKDRVEALAGRFRVASPVGNGTTLIATMPIGTTALDDSMSG